MRPVSQTMTRCLVCGFAEVRTDEVVDRGVVFLAECPRCEYRWTSTPVFESCRAQPAMVRAPRRVSGEAASAA